MSVFVHWHIVIPPRDISSNGNAEISLAGNNSYYIIKKQVIKKKMYQPGNIDYCYIANYLRFNNIMTLLYPLVIFLAITMQKYPLG